MKQAAAVRNKTAEPLIVDWIRIGDAQGPGIVSLVLHGTNARTTAVSLPMFHERSRIESLIINEGPAVPSVTIWAGRGWRSRLAAVIFMALSRVILEFLHVDSGTCR